MFPYVSKRTDFYQMDEAGAAAALSAGDEVPGGYRMLHGEMHMQMQHYRQHFPALWGDKLALFSKQDRSDAEKGASFSAASTKTLPDLRCICRIR